MSSITFATLSALVAEGNVSTLRCYLDNKHINVDERDENGQTLLIIACQLGQAAVVQELLQQGADVNAEDYDNWSGLLNAAKENHSTIVSDLLDHGADIEHRDVGGWTALMWACYKGCTETAHILLEHGATVNTHDLNHISCLVWAAGRGYTEIVRDLLAHGAKVNSGDKYGTTPLVWASRKGYLDIVEELLQAGANVDTAGMFSWTPLIVAAKGNHVEVVNLLLEYKPNVNAVDMDGCTALTIACKEGFADIAVALLKSGAYVNLQDRSGDTNLIHATKAGHIAVVEALIKKYADVDIQGADRKTALYWGAEKGYVDIVRTLLKANPNLEIATKDGDTALMKATRNRNLEIVQMLVDKKARVSATDKKGDTALHIAMRARSKGIVEVLLRNPKNSQLLYRPNRAGETPYNIDTSHQKSILSQIFGARRLNTNEDSENMLGYDLYGSALADILSEPSLSMPISVGLYAKWGSGKSFLLNKLTEEMRSFAIQWLEPSLEFSWLLLLVVVILALLFGVSFSLASRYWIIGITIGLGFFFVIYSAFGFVKCASTRYDWNWANAIGVYVAERINSLKVLLQVIFCHPPATRKDLSTLPVRFLFADQTKISSAGGDMSLAQIVIALYMAIEDELGFFTTRLYCALKPKAVASPTWKWRRLCCIPNFVVFLLVIVCALAALVLTVVYGPLRNYMKDDFIDDDDGKRIGAAIVPVLITLACIIGVVILSNMYTLLRMMMALVVSHQRRIQHNLAQFESPRADGYIETLKAEVDTMNALVKCLDAFIGQQTRLVIIVDGLDSCEQEKVLRVLDAVHLLFSDPNAPFITVLAIDPHIIIKAIEANICRVLNNTSIRGHDYLRNIVHLPFYLQNSGLRRVKASQQAAMQQAKRNPSYWVEESQGDSRALPSARKSSISSMSIPDAFRKGRKGNQKLKASESVASSISNLHRMMTGAQDLTKVLLTDDYFSDVNPRSMRRLMNIVYITGRLLKAFNIDFNWYHLASWVNITEQWPYRTSWMILYYELHEADLEDTTPLKMIFEKIKTFLPTSREVEPMLDLDHDEKKFEVFLSFHSGSLLISDLKVFLPFTINLDPYIRKSIQEKQNYTDLLMPGVKSSSSHHAIVPHGQPPASSFMSPPSGWMPPHVAEPVDHHWIVPSHSARHGWPAFAHRGPPCPPSGGFTPQPHPCIQGGLSWENNITSVAPLSAALKVTTIDTVIPKNQKLSSLPIEGVINLLSTIDGIDKTKIKTYTNALLHNNIHGRVLLTCDLNELKEVLKMSFGDWELFRLLILALRQQELQDSLVDPSSEKSGATSSQVPVISRSERSSMKRPQNKTTNASDEAHDVGKGREAPAPVSRANTSEAIEKPSETCFTQRSRPSASAPLEKQVTMEESMICGALETLNEEAHEDALEERRTLERGDVAGLVTPSPLSPIFSDPEEQSLDDHPHVSQIANTIIGSFANPPGEISVMYLKNLHGTPSHARLSPISASAPDIEWAISSNKQVILSPTDFSPASSNSMLADIGMSAPPSIASSPPTKSLVKVVSLDSEPVSPSKKSLQGSEERKQPRHPIIHKPSAITITPDISSLVLPIVSRQRDKPIRSITLNGDVPTGCSLPIKPRSSSLISHADSQHRTGKKITRYRKHSEHANSDSSDSLNSETSEKSKTSAAHVAFKRDTAEIAKRFAKHRNVSLTKHGSDADSSEDEQTPLVSPVQSSRSILPTANPDKTSPSSPRKKPTPVTFHSSSSGGGQVRSPLERQFSLDIPCTDESAMLVASASPENETPTGEDNSQRVLHRRQISLALAQSQPLTLLSSPSSDGGGSGFSGPNSPNSQESSVSLHVNSSETIL